MSTIILLGQKGQHLYIGMAFSCECTGLRSVLDLGVAHMVNIDVSDNITDMATF